MLGSFFVALGFLVLVLGWEGADQLRQRMARRWLALSISTVGVGAAVYAAYFLTGAGFYLLLVAE